MALLDLSQVTRTLVELLKLHIPAHLEPGLALNVTAQPPEAVGGGAQNTISVHLYHVAEDPAYKNRMPAGRDVPAVAHAPLALSLYYLVTAHHSATEEAGTLAQQKLMGYALKTLHDFPVVTDTTRVGATFILPIELRGHDNRLQIIYRPVGVDDALHYWAGGETRTTRLSAYYEVRVILLEPEPARLISGPVLRVGTFVLDLHAPALDDSASVVRFTLPAAVGGGEQALVARPARAALAPGGPPEAPLARVVLTGSGLRGRTRVLLRSPMWRRLGVPADVLPIDADPAWHVLAGPGEVRFDVQPQLAHAGGSAPIFPGIHGVSVEVTRSEQIVLGETRRALASSNEIAFAIAPRLTGHGAPDPGTGRVRIDLAPTFDLAAPVLRELVELIVGGVVYRRVNAFSGVPADDAGAYTVASSSVTAQPLFPTSTPGFHPVRLLVNGAESQPFWIEV